jgi:hypothetical protein
MAARLARYFIPKILIIAESASGYLTQEMSGNANQALEPNRDKFGLPNET